MPSDNNAQLAKISNINKYLEFVKEKKYTVFISVSDDASTSLDDTIATSLKNLGLSTNLMGKFRYSYYAVIQPNEIVENCSPNQLLSYRGTIHNNTLFYDITSGGYTSGNCSSITIGNVEYSKSGRGINIVVYDDKTMQIIDSVCFDTCDSKHTAYR